MEKIIDCKVIEKHIMEELVKKCSELAANNIIPTLAMLKVGESSEALAYERGVVRACSEVGIQIKHFELITNTSMKELKSEIDKINNDIEIHGLLLFRPLPAHLDESEIKYWIDESKDIDCMTPANLARIFESEIDGYLPCTPAAVMEIIKYHNIDVSGKHIAVIGRSMVVGKPLSMMLLSLNATVTICHSRSLNVREIVSTADVVVAAVGKARLVDEGYIKEGAIVLDVGINIDEEGKLCGDVDFESVINKAGAITPVPGGVGSVTTAVLLKNLLKSARKRK